MAWILATRCTAPDLGFLTAADLAGDILARRDALPGRPAITVTRAVTTRGHERPGGVCLAVRAGTVFLGYAFGPQREGGVYARDPLERLRFALRLAEMSRQAKSHEETFANAVRQPLDEEQAVA
ncbi:MAG TPA: hypothetical protein VGH15_05740 [Caulobacteraceae bacterium]|jgi:hypothetical protein